MRLFPEPLEISATEGFTRAKDIFGRGDFANKLTNLVSELDGGHVILLDAKWGTGKTTFVRMWEGELTKRGLPTVYFDAFANDYQQDAFLSLASQIVGIGDEASLSDEAKRNFKDQAVKAIKVVGLTTLRVGLKALTAGVVDGADLEKGVADIVTELGDDATEGLDEFLKSKLENHKTDQMSLEGFRQALATLAGTLSVGDSTGSEDQNKIRPLIFIIDELDRCRPSFALEILESIKHFFAVPNVIFVLVSSLSSLEAAVAYAYGEIDAAAYLEKFYHLRVSLPVGRSGRPDLAAETYLRFLNCPENVAAVLVAFSLVHEVPLRTLERIVAYVKVAQMSTSGRGIFPPPVVAILCLLKVMRHGLYSMARTGNLTFDKLNEFLRLNDWKNPLDSSEPHPAKARVTEWWAYILGEAASAEVVDRIERGLAPNGMTVHDVVPYFCDLIDCFLIPEQ